MTTRIIDVLLNTTQAVNQLNRLNGQVQGVNNGMRSIANVAASGFAVAGVLVAIASYAKLIDQLNQTEAKLKLLITTEEGLAEVQSQLIKSSEELGMTTTDLTNIYSRLGNAVKGTGVSSIELIGITETLSKAFAVSGSSADESASALQQLSQGLAAGALMGDEFRSVAENAPIIMDLLAKSTGKARGELKKFASEGGITSEVVIKALNEGTEELNNKFATLPLTLDRASNNLSSSFSRLLKSMEENTKLGRGFVIVVNNIAKAMSDISNGVPEAEILQKTFTRLGNEYQAASEKFKGSGLLVDKRAMIEAARVFNNFGKDIAENTEELADQAKAIALVEKSLSTIDKLAQSRLSNERAIKDAARKVVLAKQDELDKERELLAFSLKDIEDKRGKELELSEFIIDNEVQKQEEILRIKAQYDELANLAQKESAIKQAAIITQNEDKALRERLSLEREIREKAEADFGFKGEDETEQIINSAGNDEDDSEAERLAKKNEIAHEMLQANVETELAVNKERFDAKLIQEDEYASTATGLAQDFSSDKENLDQVTADAQNQIAKGQFMTALNTFGAGSKKIFKMKKALAFAQAAVALPSAVMQSYDNAGGYPLGIPAAIAMAVTGAAQLKNIASQQMGGASSAPSISSGGAGSIPSPSSRVGQQGQNSTPTRDVNTVKTSANSEILQELRDMDSEFIPTSTARKMAVALSTVNDESGIPTQGFNE